jgi:hypothetical protein
VQAALFSLLAAQKVAFDFRLNRVRRTLCLPRAHV